MKFGVFLPNGSNGYIMSTAIEPYLPTWELNKSITLEAERQGLDFVLSMMKFRGFGGETGHWDACLESFSLMSALAAVTDRIGLFPSVTLLAQHPAYVARIMATLDDISGGRAGLNIVTGWNRPEYAQMGMWRGDEYYEQRYDYALDYVTVLRALWRDGRVTHKSPYFELDDCSCLPTPKHEIPIVSAGQSPAGRNFVAKIGAHNFVIAPHPPPPPAELRVLAADVKAAGQAEGTQVGVYALLHIVADDTDEKARQAADRIVAGGDLGAISYMLGEKAHDPVKDGSSAHVRAAGSSGPLSGDVEVGNMAFMNFPALVGSYARIAEKIDAVAAETEVEGMLFSWPDWVPGIRAFGEKIIPRLECRRGWDVRVMGGMRD